MEILREGTWPYAVTATMAKYLIPDTEKLRFELTAENTGMRADTDEIFLWLDLKNGTDDPWLELTATGFRLDGNITSYSAYGQFRQAAFPSTDDFYFTLTGDQESDQQVYWQDNTLRIVSKSPGEILLKSGDLRDTYQFPAGGCVITDFADGKIIVQNNTKNIRSRPGGNSPPGRCLPVAAVTAQPLAALAALRMRRGPLRAVSAMQAADLVGHDR